MQRTRQDKPESITGRIHDALRDDLARGVYRVGGALPSVDALRERFGAGEYAVRRALRRLRDEGFVTITRHVGAVATGKARGTWRGTVAFIAVRMSGSFFAQALEEQFAKRFASAGYSLVMVYLDSVDGKVGNVEALSRHLANGIAFAICACSDEDVIHPLDQAGVPYIIVGNFQREFPNARAIIREDFRECYADLIAAMRARGVRRVLEIDEERTIDRGFKGQLFEAGILTQQLMCRCNEEQRWHMNDVKRCGHRVVAEFLADPKNRADLPDAILFEDDYLAFGGIVAILEAGLRIPRDIRVVSFTNAGNEPVLGVSLARIVNDPETLGDAVADYVLALLAGRRAEPPRIAYRFVSGDSL